MITKKDLIGNELLREIIRIRLDALAKMLEWQKKDRLPKILEEGATGDFDNKGRFSSPADWWWKTATGVLSAKANTAP